MWINVVYESLFVTLLNLSGQCSPSFFNLFVKIKKKSPKNDFDRQSCVDILFNKREW